VLGAGQEAEQDEENSFGKRQFFVVVHRVTYLLRLLRRSVAGAVW
jgi:hypothetical protein